MRQPKITSLLIIDMPFTAITFSTIVIKKKNDVIFISKTNRKVMLQKKFNVDTLLDHINDKYTT